MRTDYLLFILGLCIILGVLHDAALEHYLYWRFWWYDMIMHTLGGAILGALVLWFARFLLPEEKARRYTNIMLAVSFALVLGIAWEVFEFTTGVERAIPLAVRQLDTVIDLALDAFGAVLSYTAFHFFPWKTT